MNKIIENHLMNFETFSQYIKKVHGEEVSLLEGFVENQHMVQRFYETYYHDTTTKRIVLCGINPGKKGAGKTGVPFLDNHSLKNLIPGVIGDDQEISNSFIYSIIQEIGVSAFFRNVYLTNFSWYGFVDKNGNNVNYYTLDPAIKDKCTEHFIEEMRQVNPLCIIPMSIDVEKSLKSITNLNIPIMERLPHPYRASFPNSREKWKGIYIERIMDIIKKEQSIVQSTQ